MNTNKKIIYRILIMLVFILCAWNIKLYATSLDMDVTVTNEGKEIEIKGIVKTGHGDLDFGADSSFGDLGKTVNAGVALNDSLPEEIIIEAKGNDKIYQGYTTIKIDFKSVQFCEDNDQYAELSDVDSESLNVEMTSEFSLYKEFALREDKLVNGQYTVTCLKPGDSSFKVNFINPGLGANHSIKITIKDIKPASTILMNNIKGNDKGPFYESKLLGSGNKTWTDVRTKVDKIIQGVYPLKSTAETTENTREQVFKINKISTNGKWGDEGKWDDYTVSSLGQMDKVIPEELQKMGVENTYLYSKVFTVRVKAQRDFSFSNASWEVKKDEVWDVKYTFYYLSDQKLLCFTIAKSKYKDSAGNKVNDAKGDNEMTEADEEYNNNLTKLNDLFGVVSGEPRPTDATFINVLNNTGEYKPEDIDDESAGKIEDATSRILTVISNIGMVASVIILAAIGVKYMIGSVEEKAEYKKDLIPYVIGACMLFGITTFMKILMTIGEKIANV